MDARGRGHSLALFVQQIEEAGGLLADQMDAANVVCVVNVVPRDPFTLVLLLHGRGDSQPIHYFMAVRVYRAHVTYKQVMLSMHRHIYI